MAVYKIVEIGDPVLREKAKPVPKITPNILKLLDNMVDTMRQAQGVGLAAPQIGVSKRVIVVEVDGQLVEMINPEIVEQSGEEISVEGCLSIPGVAGEVKRAYRVKARGLNRHGQLVEVAGQGMLARALQHEIDHLDGILFVDKTIRFIR